MLKLSEKLGMRIQELRKRNNMTQSELAELVNVEIVTISRIENGSRFPKQENIENIAQALQVKVKDLFDFEHLESKELLVKNISIMMKKADVCDLRCIYKLLNVYFESRIK